MWWQILTALGSGKDAPPPLYLVGNYLISLDLISSPVKFGTVQPTSWSRFKGQMKKGK